MVSFKVGDVALFLPTRNASGKPWAAFNINAPHYFLKPSDTVAEQMNTREWIVARITSITESTADPAVPDSNPYGLASGLHYYQLEVELWKSSRAGKSQRRSKQKRNSSRESPQAASPSQQQQELELEQGLQQEAAGLRSSTSQQLPLSNTPPRQDTGLASISLERRRLSQPGGASMVSTMHSLSPPMEDAALSESQSTPSYRHPSYPLSMSSSNVVHSYVPPTSPPSASHPERRKSAGYFSQESALDPAFVWTSQE
ncbi:autophagy-related protein 11-domain-containing protein [Syncephalastrum racemosum]|uniref:Autophagy-related protein 11 n=1 Tax=Syncephalastrum racemosum TaxID=13706 RepID=A0A1X2HHZ3_SYNRA|nr:autophagy-related protein 11-domain-containing protein [Syncephalastrum racemosum]